MATRDEIYTAIRNADKAGDSESVRKLAAYLQTMDSQAAPEQPSQPAPAAPEQGGGLMDFIQRGRQFNQDVKSAAVAGLRDLGEGAAGLFALPGNIGVMAYNVATGGNVQTPSQALSASLDAAGVPRTENRYIRAVNQALGGAGMGIGAGQVMAQAPGMATRGVGQTLAAAPRQQLGGAVGGAASQQLAADAGLGPVGQTVAGIAGGVAGASLRSGVVSGVKGTFRGGEAGRQRVADNITLFEGTAGRTPSVGQATQNRRMQGAESFLSRAPGGAGRMAAAGQGLSDDMASAIERKASTLSPKASAEQAGRTIQRQISGEGGFVEQFKATQGQLYDKLDNYIPADAQVSVGNTRAALAALNQEIKDAPNLSKWFQNSRIKAIQEALDADTALPPRREVRIGANGTSEVVDVPQGPRSWMPYESIKKIRTLVGNEMADSGIASDVPRSKWKALYAALSRDLEGAANQAGPEARNAWARANTYTRFGMSRIESISHVIDKAGGPEKIYAAAISGTKEGATTLRAVMQSLPEEGQKTISATVLRRLGRATAGTQNDVGDAFSTETFLTNWNNLSPQAKATLFDRYGAGFRQDMDKVARVAANLRAGSQVFRNPSGTAQAGVQYATVAGAAGAAASGNLPAVAWIISGVAASNAAARLLTHPPFVRWLATTTAKPAGALPSAINQLAQSRDPVLREAATILAEQQGQQPAN